MSEVSNKEELMEGFWTTLIYTVRTDVLYINVMKTELFPNLISDQYILQDLCAITVHYTG